jgi:tRNA modification GTPase
MSTRSTIFALSSGRPPAAIAVIRLCGPQAGPAIERLIGRVPRPRQAALARVRDLRSGDVIDEALALWFPGPRSETGEDMAELQLHGGPAVIAGVLEALGSIEGCRPAEPGEFTRRAFENGRLDLTQVEGLGDLIAAETSAQRRQALRQLKGMIGNQAEEWRRRIIEALALVEVGIDFSDEADVPEDLLAPALVVVRRLRDEIAARLTQAGHSERLRDGLVVAIAGPVNAGKSTLFNRLARREAAIVSPHAGTTRDVIEVHLDLAGFPVTVLDTAGIRESDDPVEREGIRRARERASTADVVLWVVDGSSVEKATSDHASGVVGAENWLVLNKVDLTTGGPRGGPGKGVGPVAFVDRFSVSSKTGAGMDQLVTALTAFAHACFSSAETTLVTRLRHRRALQETVDALSRALEVAVPGRDELVAEELRVAAMNLGRLTGRVDVEDILDAIFRDFCIGK